MSIAFSPDSRQVVNSGGAQSPVRVWDISDVTDILENTLPVSGALCLRFSADGQRLVVASIDMSLHVFEVDGNAYRSTDRLIGNLDEMRSGIWRSGIPEPGLRW